MISFNMLIPEMNEYITGLGGENEKWKVLGYWTIAAALCRPFSGKIADNISRKSVMFFGVIVSIGISFLYPMFTTVSGFLMLRFIHGISTGFQPTGASALVADLIPEGRRGEAMGIFGVMFTLGFSLGQGMGSTVKGMFGMDGLFYTAGILGLIPLIVLFFVKEDKSIVRQNAKDQGYDTFWKKVLPKRKELLGLEVFKPTMVMFLTASLAGMYFLLIPDLSDHLGFDNKGSFWLVYVGFTIVTRLVAGKTTDKFGARNNLLLCCLLLIFASYLTGTAETEFQFNIGAIIYGIGSGMGSPALFTWAADLANPLYKGRGMGTLFIALELGILFGNFLGQQLYNNNPANFDLAFMTGGGLCVLAFIFLIFVGNSTKPALN
ncbi:MAG: MFS family permease [Arenicella sp.]|jgi:MFS family permease